MVPVAHKLMPTRTLSSFTATTAALLCLFCTASALAQGTHLWTQSRIDEFEKGSPQGVAITSEGRLLEGPGLKEVLTTPSTFVWSVAADKHGAAFIGTGTPASVLRVTPDGKQTTLLESRDLAVQVVRVGPDGSLYAAVLPSGKIYKLNPAATSKQDQDSATVVFDLARASAATQDAEKKDESKEKQENKSRYIWDITFDSSGRMYIATGGPGIIYRIDPSKPDATPEAFFKSDEQHIRSLAWDAKGNLIAGSDGSGLVYRISPEGNGYVLFEAPRREITSVAVSANGTIYAASVGDKSHNPLPPLPVQGTGSVTITVVQPGSYQAANASTSAPEGTEIYALRENQAPRKLWSDKDEIVYALAARPEGLLALSGNRGRIFTIREDGSYSDIGHVEAQQSLSLCATPDAVLIGTGNTGKLVSLKATEQHEYYSDVLDAGALARFGRVEVEPGSSAYQLFTRTGNVEQPVRNQKDWGWSDWQPVNQGIIASPAGRYLQWKAVLNKNGSLGSVGVNYLPVNAAPVIDDLVVVPGARLNSQAQQSQSQNVNISFPNPNSGTTISFDTSSGNSGSIQATKDRTAVTARWAAHDDNGDDLVYSLFLRGDGEKVWRLLKDNITEKAYTFDQTALPDGGYTLKVVASDAPSHTPGDVLTGDKISDRFELDTTPPVVSNLRASVTNGASVRVMLDAEDAISPIAHAEYSLDAGPWQYFEPVGGLSDSPREHYDFQLPASALEKKPGEHLLTIRVYDRHDNIGLAKTTFETSAGAAK